MKKTERLLGFFHGGEGGIRTLDTLAGMRLFESRRFDHSRTSPCCDEIIITTDMLWII